MVFEEVSTLSTAEIEKRLETINNKLSIVVHQHVLEQLYGYIEMYQTELMERMVVDDWNANLAETVKPLDSEVGEAVAVVEKGTRPTRKRVRFDK